MKLENREIHEDFLYYLEIREQGIIDLFRDLRSYILEIYPDANELLYHTHALTTTFSLSEKLSHAFCMIPIYTNHMNLGFNKGTLLPDPHNLLKGTGKWIRHIPVRKKEDYRNDSVKALIHSAIEFSLQNMDKPTKVTGQIISKINR